MPGPWNDTTDRLLLLIIIKLTAPKLPNWEEVANAMGPGFTAESTRQHFQKIRKTVDAAVNGDGAATPKTPKTPKSATKSKKSASATKSSGKKRKIAETEDDEEPQNGVEDGVKQEDVDNEFD